MPQIELTLEECRALLNACPTKSLGHLLEDLCEAHQWMGSSLFHTLLTGMAVSRGIKPGTPLKPVLNPQGTISVEIQARHARNLKESSSLDEEHPSVHPDEVTFHESLTSSKSGRRGKQKSRS